MKPGEALDIESQIFSDWIIGHYQEKNVRYVITYGNDYIIFSGRIWVTCRNLNPIYYNCCNRDNLYIAK